MKSDKEMQFLKIKMLPNKPPSLKAQQRLCISYFSPVFIWAVRAEVTILCTGRANARKTVKTAPHYFYSHVLPKPL